MLQGVVLVRIMIRGEGVVKATAGIAASATPWVANRLASVTPSRRQTIVHSELIVSSLFSQRWLPILVWSPEYSRCSILESTWATSPSLH
jgi:hypothetical protein